MPYSYLLFFAKGRIKIDGKIAILPKSVKNKAEKEAKDDTEKVNKKQKIEKPLKHLPPPKDTKEEEVDNNPSWGHHGGAAADSWNNSSWSTSGEPNKGDTGTRVFLGIYHTIHKYQISLLIM